MSKKNKLLLIIVALLLIVNGGVAAYYFFFMTNDNAATADKVLSEEEMAALEAERLAAQAAFDEEYYLLRFTFGDAVEVCYQEVQSRNNNLIQGHLNELSTKYNEEEGVYIVMVDTVVGSAFEHSEKSHTCHVDPKTQSVSYYKEVLRRTSIRPVE